MGDELHDCVISAYPLPHYSRQLIEIPSFTGRAHRDKALQTLQVYGLFSPLYFPGHFQAPVEVSSTMQEFSGSRWKSERHTISVRPFLCLATASLKSHQWPWMSPNTASLIILTKINPKLLHSYLYKNSWISFLATFSIKRSRNHSSNITTQEKQQKAQL